MGACGTSLLLLSLVVAQDKPAPKFSISKETTYVTGPIDKDGYIDFEAALNERIGKGITPEKNANVLIWKALGPTPIGEKGKPADYFKVLGIEEPPKNGDYLIGLKEYLADQLKLDDNDIEAIDIKQSTRARERPWSAKEYPQLAAWLKANEKPLALAIEASKRPDFFNPVASRQPNGERGLMIGSMLPATQRSRAFARALVIRAMLRLQEGKSDEAWQDLLAVHRLGRLIARGPSGIEALAGSAIDGAAYGHASQPDVVYLVYAKLSSEQTKQRLKDLESLPPLPNMADKVELHGRLEFLDSMQSVIRDAAKGFLKMNGAAKEQELAPEQRQAFEMIEWTPTMRSANQWYDRMVAAMRLADRAQRKIAFDALDKDFEAMKKEGVHPASVEELKNLVEGDKPPYRKLGDAVTKSIGNICIRMLAPDVRKLRESQDRAEQFERNLHLAFALAAYCAERGEYPAKLQELTPKYVPSVPDDLFSGKPLVYRLTDHGYLLYSIGPNGQDDGGRSPYDTPRGDDLAIRMPLPELKPAK
jgi:hypothetical protein